MRTSSYGRFPKTSAPKASSSARRSSGDRRLRAVGMCQIVLIRDERPATTDSSELHPLGQRQLAGIIDGIGTLAHVGPPRVRAGLPSAAGFLLAAERAADLRPGRADVDIGDSAVGFGQESFGLAQV